MPGAQNWEGAATLKQWGVVGEDVTEVDLRS